LKRIQKILFNAALHNSVAGRDWGFSLPIAGFTGKRMCALRAGRPMVRWLKRGISFFLTALTILRDRPGPLAGAPYFFRPRRAVPAILFSDKKL